MSDLTATQCGCTRGGSSGCNGNSIIWIILILCMCNQDNGFSLCGGGHGDNDGCQCILLLLLLSCCGGCNSIF